MVYDVALWLTWSSWAVSWPEYVEEVEAAFHTDAVYTLMQRYGLAQVYRAAVKGETIMRRYEDVKLVEYEAIALSGKR